MINFRTNVSIWCAVLGSMTCQAAQAEGPVDRFIAALDTNAAVPAEAKQLLKEKWAQCQDCDAEEFLTQGLAVFSTPFREGLDAYDSDDYARCAELMNKLAADADPFIAVNAAGYEIKALVGMDRTIEALTRIENLLADGEGKLLAYSYFGPEISFLRGFCLLTDLRYDDAHASLKTFLEQHGDAPQRLLIPARQMFLELENRDEEKLGQVVDLMGYSGRRLKNADGGVVVQERQKKIVDLLDDLIKQAEEQEQQACKNSGSSGGNSKGSQSPSNPMQQSGLPGGPPQSEGGLRTARRANPGESWGAMPPAERERILQAIRESFPSRYRQLVEQYYEELAKKP